MTKDEFYQSVQKLALNYDLQVVNGAYTPPKDNVIKEYRLFLYRALEKKLPQKEKVDSFIKELSKSCNIAEYREKSFCGVLVLKDVEVL